MIKKQKKTRTKKPASKGLGDTVEKVLEATGVAKIAKWILGEDCGCEERKEKLNQLFKYRKPECLLEHEYKYLKNWFEETRNSIKPSEQRELLSIHNRVFKTNTQTTNCSSCIRELVDKLRLLYNTYKEENA